ncbi:RING/U-box superfamily protein [Euphorbia peplus]|nr:RING/U-box superfamily protein [Euphorbia peplus]
MNTSTTHHHNLKQLALIYGVSAAAILTLSIILVIACFYNRRRLFPPPQHGGASDEDSESVIIETGVNEDIVKSYPKIIYRQHKIEKGDSISGSCSICLAEYNDTDVLLLMPDCRHFFHFGCIDEWLKMHPTCPICRKSPPPESESRDNRIAPFNLWFVPFTHSA